jgi:hypothetical protein
MTLDSLLKPLLYAWEYLKEISGENAYDRYLLVHTATHPENPPLFSCQWSCSTAKL